MRARDVLDLEGAVFNFERVTPRKSLAAADYRPRIPREARLAASLEQLARLDAGGSATNTIDVESASSIEPRALSTPCLRCDGPYRLDEHLAEVRDGQRVRILDVHCAHCGAPRTFFFRVVPTTSS